MPKQVHLTAPELYAQSNGLLLIREPSDKKPLGYAIHRLGHNVEKGRAAFAKFLEKRGIKNIDAKTCRINSGMGLLDNDGPSPNTQITRMRISRANNGHAGNGTALVVSDPAERKRAAARQWYQDNKNRVTARRKKALQQQRDAAFEAAGGTLHRQMPKMAKDKLAEAKDLVQIIAGAWAAASTALRRLESLLGSD